MAEVVRNSLSYLTDADLLAMAEYLKSMPPESRLRTGRKAADPTRAQGAALYMDNCGGCHQATGRGVPGVFPPLAGNGVVVAADPNNILKVVDGGIKARGGYIAMPSFKDQLTDQQVAEIANYIRTSWGNSAAPNATPAMVAKMRAAAPLVQSQRAQYVGVVDESAGNRNGERRPLGAAQDIFIEVHDTTACP